MEWAVVVAGEQVVKAREGSWQLAGEAAGWLKLAGVLECLWPLAAG